MIFGVCAGVADYFGFDLKITRVCVAVGGLVFFPTVIVIYVIMGLLLDDNPRVARERAHEQRRAERREQYDELRRRVRSEPKATLRSVRHRFRDLDRRLQRLEKHVTSKKYRLQRELDGLGD
jgi:phage shock protein C